MSFSRHAYRHALQQQHAASLFLDHVWISEEHLASAFRRFANNCQRRHQSWVPGPLEARRRLAKRKNTAMAVVVGGAGPPVDVGSLFGVNGSGHLRGGGNDPLSTTRSWPEPLEIFSYSIPPPEPALPASRGGSDFGVNGLPLFDSGSDDRAVASRIIHNQQFNERLQDCRTVQDIKNVVDLFRVDVPREPACSRRLFSQLLSKAINSTNKMVDEILLFLDDPTLNSPAAGNYSALMKHLTRYEMKPAQRHKLLGAVERAVELGLIRDTEIGLIIKALSNVKAGGTTLKSPQNLGEFIRHHRRIWEALRGCSVLHLRDLDGSLLDQWFSELLLGVRSNEELLYLAKDIVLAGQESCASVRRWIPTLIGQCMRLSVRPSRPFHYRKAMANYICDLLRPLDGDLAAEYLLQVAENLAFSQTSEQDWNAALENWRRCLLHVPNAESVASSRVWLDVQPSNFQNVPTEHRIVLRLWMLSALRKALREDYHDNWLVQPKATDPTIITLLKQFDRLTSAQNEADFFANLIHVLQQLHLPYNTVVTTVYTVMTMRKLRNQNARKVLEQLERSQVILEELVADTKAFNATKSFLFPTFERMIRRIDVTTPEFVRDSICLVESGKQGALDLQRLLASHTPLHIALAKAWPRLPKPSEAELYRLRSPERKIRTVEPETEKPVILSEPLTEEEEEELSKYDGPDPRACVEVMHLLALTFASSEKLRAADAFEMVHWLYVFLYRHHAPIKPALARAMYHAGVVRYRRERQSVPLRQYRYIMDVVRKFEGAHVLRMLEMTPLETSSGEQSSIPQSSPEETSNPKDT